MTPCHGSSFQACWLISQPGNGCAVPSPHTLVEVLATVGVVLLLDLQQVCFQRVVQELIDSCPAVRRHF